MTAAVEAAPAAPRCPYSRSFSYVTGEYTIGLGWGDFSSLMDDVLALWDRAPGDEKTSDMFEALVDRIAVMREWTSTGWGGIPAKYLTAGGKP